MTPGGILLDVSRLLARQDADTPTGVDRVTLNYLLHFLDHPHWRLLAVTCSFGYVRTLDAAELLALAQRLRTAWLPAHKLALSSLHLPPPDSRTGDLHRVVTETGTLLCSGPLARVAANHQFRWIYLNVSHDDVEVRAYMQLLREALGLNVVIFVHDLIPITHPEFTGDGQTEKHRRRLANALRMADLLLVNSRHTATELAAHAQEAGLACPAIEPLTIGVEPLSTLPQARDTLPGDLQHRPYFVVLGTIEPRKNHLLLLKIWQHLAEAGAQPMPVLVIVGKRGWKNAGVFELLDHSAELQTHVMELSSVNDAELAALLTHCQALLFPSHVEGWGMPVLEALSLGVPVICNDLPVFRESAGTAPLYLDIEDLNGWQQAIMEAAQGRREVQVPALPDWSQHFAALEELLRSLPPAPPVTLRLHPVTGPGRQVQAWLLVQAVTGIPERRLRQLRKLRNAPMQFLLDSALPPLRFLGSCWQRLRGAS